MATEPIPAYWFNNEFTTTPSPQTTTSLTELVTQESSIFTPELLKSLKDIGCPFDCNSNGECQHGRPFLAFIYALLFCKLYKI